MGEISIKIKIADREYPMRINTEEEERIRRAGKLVNDKIKFFRENVGIRDVQDLLAMTAFDVLSESLKIDDKLQENDHQLEFKIEQLFNKISNS